MTVTITVRSGSGTDSFPARAGETLGRILAENGYPLALPCGSRGTCGGCRVRVLKGAPSPSDGEKALLTKEERDAGVRLACRTAVTGPMEVELFTESDGAAILTDGVPERLTPDPVVKKKALRIPQERLRTGTPDWELLREALGVPELKAELMLLRRLPELIKNPEGFTGACYEDRLLDLEPGNREEESYGLAIDIGTTTAVCYLLNLQTGKLLDAEAGLNRQSRHGADVISRIQFASENSGGPEELRELIVGQLNGMIRSLCGRCGIDVRNLYHAVVAGNTTMTHLFLGLPAGGLAQSPFRPVLTSAADFPAAETGLDVNGIVTVLPGFSAYVGGDILAGILASGLAESEEPSLLLDLGTNGEMAVGNRKGILTCSVAAGPAFEGGNLKYGMGGTKGAIAGVRLDRQPNCRTIGGKASGICGSGALDTVYELLRHGLADDTGRLAPPEGIADPALAERMLDDEEGRRFVLETDTENGLPITFSQKDMRQMQLAKAAVSAGIAVLLKESGITPEEIRNVYLAGGFGNYLNPESALGIGLISPRFSGKLRSVGNAAGAGARLCLLSREYREKAEQIAKTAGYLELSGRADFQEEFIEAMTFE